MMTTVAGSFTAVGVSAVLGTRNVTEDITFTISGTYAATVQIEKSTTPAMLSWQVVGGPFSTANASVTKVVTSGPNDRFRVRCVAFTSGTVNYTFSDGDATTQSVVNPDGEVIYEIKQSGLIFNGSGGAGADISAIQAQLPEAGTRLNTFLLLIQRNSGALQARIGAIADPSFTTTANSPDITGHTVNLTTIPDGTDASTAFAGGVKIGSASTNVLHINTPAQLLTDMDAVAIVQNNNTTKPVECRAITSNIDINGVTRRRLALQFAHPDTGAAFPLNTTTFDADSELVIVAVRAFLNQ